MLQYEKIMVRFQVIMVVSTKSTVVLHITRLSLVEIYSTRVTEVLTASIIKAVIGLMMEAAVTSETLVNFTRLHSATSQKIVTFFKLIIVITE
jgi:hypothetical protein